MSYVVRIVVRVVSGSGSEVFLSGVLSVVKRVVPSVVVVVVFGPVGVEVTVVFESVTLCVATLKLRLDNVVTRVVTTVVVVAVFGAVGIEFAVVIESVTLGAAALKLKRDNSAIHIS